MTPYALLLQACGLSQPEAAGFHGVRLDTVKSWSAGRNRVPPQVLADLRSLYQTIAKAAAHALLVLHTAPDGAEIEIGYPVDDHEAQTLGLPCLGAWRAMAGIVVAKSLLPVVMVPRGSTPATAAAIEAHKP